MVDPETFARYAKLQVPRYTSYPTAPNFGLAKSDTQYRGWLRDLPHGSTASLYLHIPFCREMCWYCGCHTTVAKRRAPVSRYVATLAREIRLVAAELGRRVPIRHLHWGGGSPTLLSPSALKGIDALLRRHFDISSDAEIAVEIDPRTLSLAKAAAFGSSGVNRASVGVQSFDRRVQVAINRIQSFAQTKAAIDLLRGHGINGINLDLVYGLPFQTAESCARTVEQALRLRPDRFAVFGYAHVPDFKPHQRKIDRSSLPSTDERFEQSRVISQQLTAAGYEQIGIDHFALPDDSLSRAARSGTLHRNFQGYTSDPCSTLIGVGASAISRLPQGYVQNAVRIPEYQRQIGMRRLPVARICPLSDDDVRRARIIEQLMCNFDVETDVLYPHQLRQLEADGLIRRDGSRIRVESDARPLVRAIAAAFDSYLPRTTATHVTAV